LWLGWVRLVRALERLLVIHGVNEMTNDERLRLHVAFARVCGPCKAPGSEGAAGWGSREDGPPRLPETHGSFVWSQSARRRLLTQLASCKTLASYAPALCVSLGRASPLTALRRRFECN
jgi:hypothetical protein